MAKVLEKFRLCSRKFMNSKEERESVPKKGKVAPSQSYIQRSRSFLIRTRITICTDWEDWGEKGRSIHCNA